jgi:hypothetical protein
VKSRRPVNSDVRCFLFEISMRVLNHAKLSAEAVTDMAQEIVGAGKPQGCDGSDSR